MNLDWISQEAKTIHEFFVSFFYMGASLLLVIGVLIEFGKFPLGGVPAFTQLLGRTVIAVMLLVAYPEISNFVTLIGDEVAAKVGDLNSISKIMESTGAIFKGQSWSWTSTGDLIIWIISFVVYFILYITVFIFDAALVYCIILLYTFSPLLILFYILPQTASMTSGLFRTLFEIVSWKVIWSVLATLLWSTSLQHFKPEDGTNFITQLALVILLTLSVLLTPLVVRSLISGGLGQLFQQATSSAMGSMTFGVLSQQGFKPMLAKQRIGQAYSHSRKFANKISGKKKQSKSSKTTPEAEAPDDIH